MSAVRLGLPGRIVAGVNADRDGPHTGRLIVRHLRRAIARPTLPERIDSYNVGHLTMNHVSNDARRCRLLPKLAFLALLEVVARFVPRNPTVLMISLMVILSYVAFLVLSTRDVVASCDYRLSPWDRELFRWSGPLAVLIGIVLIVLAACSMDTPVPESWIASPVGLFTVKYLMEVGLVLSIACWCANLSLRHVPPVILWRVIVAPLLLIYGSYVILIPVSQFAGDCDQDRSSLISNQNTFDDLAAEDIQQLRQLALRYSRRKVT